MKELTKKYEGLRAKIKSFNYADFLISWDLETTAPISSMETSSKWVGNLVEMRLQIERSPEYIDTVNELYKNIDKLPALLQIEIKKVYKEINKNLKIPSDEIIKYRSLLAKSPSIWAKAKSENDFNIFADTLKEIIAFNKRYTKYLETPTKKGYDVLLDDYEEGMNKTKYDEFFNLLRKEIVPLVKKINDKHIVLPNWCHQQFDIEKQKKFSEYIMKVMDFDRNRGFMAESEHPFTSAFGTNDVRVTNHYYSNLLLSSIFSAIHELGHATYEQQCNPILDDTFLGSAPSMAMHESQSRFYENIIGRDYHFWGKHYGKLQEIFSDELKNVSLDDFYKYVNYVECSLIRTEADELTYPLHIMVRYEIEKAIIESDVSVNDLPTMWNKLYHDYLGIDVPSFSEGILQDVHWAGGSFGYFPTYALGSAYASQLYHQMQKEINIKDAVTKDTLKDINLWLKEKVHFYGATKQPQELLKDATYEEFNPKYYVEYLKNKFTKIYNL